MDGSTCDPASVDWRYVVICSYGLYRDGIKRYFICSYGLYAVTGYIVTVDNGMSYKGMAHIARGYIFVADIVMAYLVMACMCMAVWPA